MKCVRKADDVWGGDWDTDGSHWTSTSRELQKICSKVRQGHMTGIGGCVEDGGFIVVRLLEDMEGFCRLGAPDLQSLGSSLKRWSCARKVAVIKNDGFADG